LGYEHNLPNCFPKWLCNFTLLLVIYEFFWDDENVLELDSGDYRCLVNIQKK
jgi:hypothetical protein